MTNWRAIVKQWVAEYNRTTGKEAAIQKCGGGWWRIVYEDGARSEALRLSEIARRAKNLSSRKKVI